MKKYGKWILAALLVVIGIIAVVVFLIPKKSSPAKEVVKLIEEDKGSKINVFNIYYNEEQAGYIVEFSLNGKSDTATVIFNEKIVGYSSDWNLLAERMYDESLSAEEIKKVSQSVIDHPYQAAWEINLVLNGTSSRSGWELIEY